MNLKKIAAPLGALLFVAITSCSGGGKPENVVGDAIAQAEQRCPAVESGIFGKMESYGLQAKEAEGYVTGYYADKKQQLADKYENGQMSEKSVKKYYEESQQLEAARRQAEADVKSHYDALVTGEIDRAFADRHEIEVPVEISSRYADVYEGAGCFLTQCDEGLSMYLEVKAKPAGYYTTMTISGDKNALEHGSFHIKMLDGEGKRIPRSPDYVTFNASDDNVFWKTFTLPLNDLYLYHGLTTVVLSQD